ncbi:glutathione-disulfide reductase [Aurantimonas sp. VKM B-3413]|uniref:glutathione-disulfide reductase n=1 Tax=Aurantimonas sp. VKM B-3413 TaxID=2779401 RepID=UPI001E2D4EA2|nr:glutathione-disulfide reductase [Aurantimonas sp. VKM B-3413]MCB8837495.1 glutathione-disulfide reductase [Aurantimonas sp. VKM B-3413]
MSTAGYDYDLFVIGGGSGGVRAARRAAMLGKKVAIAEEYRFGGTCVIRGCVPKKLLVYASQFSEAWEDARGYGWQFGEKRFDWAQLIANKDGEIERLERIYHANVEKAGAEVLMSRAVLEGPHEIRLTATDKRVTAETIVIATGGRPNPHPGLPGAEHCITSEEAFHLKRLPQSIVILGGGYIAVEFANIFLGLGVETTLVYRGQEILQGFDDDIRHELHQAMAKKGMEVRCRDTLEEVRQKADGRLEVRTACGDVLDADEVMLAIGRKANTENLGCEKAGIEIDKRGAIVVDEYSRTSVENIYAIGDVTHRMQLTPVAIHEAMCLVETLYRNNPTKPDYDTVATAVFSQPEIGTVGLTEHQAAETFDEIEVYKTIFRPMKHTLSGRDEKMMIKLIVDAASRKVVGTHILGPDAGELAQALGIVVKAGVTKDQFDATMAVHPTAAEEIVTMYEPSYRVKNGERQEK